MWIEIHENKFGQGKGRSHPPHGGCGLKCIWPVHRKGESGSSPARGMWIEIASPGSTPMPSPVIPRTGDVDWNKLTAAQQRAMHRHPPHGGCGLKFMRQAGHTPCSKSSPARGMWIEILRACVIALSRHVIPRTGDVDWNRFLVVVLRCLSGHPPHGGCGLK